MAGNGNSGDAKKQTTRMSRFERPLQAQHAVRRGMICLARGTADSTPPENCTGGTTWTNGLIATGTTRACGCSITHGHSSSPKVRLRSPACQRPLPRSLPPPSGPPATARSTPHCAAAQRSKQGPQHWQQAGEGGGERGMSPKNVPRQHYHGPGPRCYNHHNL